jgi:hypothetical protein
MLIWEDSPLKILGQKLTLANFAAMESIETGKAIEINMKSFE